MTNKFSYGKNVFYTSEMSAQENFLEQSFTYILVHSLSAGMDRFEDELFSCLEKLGYQARTTSIENLHLMHDQVNKQRDQGLLDKQFYQERLSFFDFQFPHSLPKAQSIIVVAVPRPQTRAIFTWNGSRRSLIIPPTYTAHRGVRLQVENLLKGILSEKGYTSTGTALPLKLLAVRSGLGQYGRNNLCYVSGLGSFHQLVAVYSDMPCNKDDCQKATMLQSCNECELCRGACPTGAISSDRFLLRAERCISYHNEKKGDVPFPSWIDVSWHNCLEGCMRCQRACPLNKQFLGYIGAEEEFSEEETDLLLNGASRDSLPEETLRKTDHLDITDDLDILPRNVGVFFNSHKSK